MKKIAFLIQILILIIAVSSCQQTSEPINNSSAEEMEKLINTTDRTRLFAIQKAPSLGRSDADMKTVNFLERAIDLDGNPTTKEYLVYIMGMDNCGSGGCNLFVISNDNKVISSTTVVNLPIYINQSDKQLEKWKDLIVWSNGSYRKLIAKDGKYSSNASMAKEVAKNEILNHPKQYIKVLDHLEKK